MLNEPAGVPGQCGCGCGCGASAGAATGAVAGAGAGARLHVRCGDVLAAPP